MLRNHHADSGNKLWDSSWQYILVVCLVCSIRVWNAVWTSRVSGGGGSEARERCASGRSAQNCTRREGISARAYVERVKRSGTAEPQS